MQKMLTSKLLACLWVTLAVLLSAGTADAARQGWDSFQTAETFKSAEPFPEAEAPILLAKNSSKNAKPSVSKASAKSIAVGSVRVSGARAVSVQLVKGSRPYYKVRLILPDGKVKNVKVDAMTGSVR